MRDLFKVGDRVQVVNDHEIWLGNSMLQNQVLEVVDDCITDRDDARIWVDDLNQYPDDFILYSRPSVDVAAVGSVSVSPFSLKLTDDGRHIVGIGAGLIGETSDRESIMALSRVDNGQALVLPEKFAITSEVTVRDDQDVAADGDIKMLQPYGKVISDAQLVATPKLGVYRPELESRKVGKVRVELVDDGFPLALRAIAQVMTWAQTAKGYKDHDWQNLPDAEIALAAAASRHRTDHIKQRVVEGLPISECVDHESELLHKAHEAFGVLAQLELMLRGAFDDRTSD